MNIHNSIPSSPATANHAAPLLDRAGALAHRGVNAVRDGSQQLGERALRASDLTLDYVRGEPVKALLIAAAAGAALMALLGLVTRSGERR